MIRDFLLGASRQRTRRRRPARLPGLEALEGRRLLSGNPTVYTVDLVSDTGAGSGTTGDLLYAVNQANANTNPAGSIIQFDPTIFNASTPQSIVLTHTLDLTGTAGPIVIDGPALALSGAPPALTISGNDAVRVFDSEGGVTATVSGLSITSGLASGNGGGVLNEGTLTLSDCLIENNTAAGSGGGIENDASMTAKDCLILKDDAGGSYGGGISSFGELSLVDAFVADSELSGVGGDGGGLFSAGSLNVENSQIIGNSVTDGNGGGLANTGTANISLSIIEGNSVEPANGGGGEGGGIDNDGNLTLVDSAVFENSSGAYGGGIENNSDMSIRYSTIAQNSASGQGGGIYTIDNLQAVNVTIVDNTVESANGGGGLYATGTTTPTLINTIVAENEQFVGTFLLPDDIVGTINPNSSSNNLIGVGGSGGLTSASGNNRVGVADPGLGSLAMNGGPTPTLALLPGSPAIDAGANIPNSGATDQRGSDFARIYNGGIDIGAYELQPAVITAVSVDWGSSGTAVLQTAGDGLRLLPAGRNTDMPWLGIKELQITLNQPETLTAADVTVSSLRGVQYGPGTVTAVFTATPIVTPTGFSYDIIFAQPIDKPDRITITIAGPEIVSYTRRLDVLPGDFDDNGVVNSKDITAIRNEWKGKDGAQPTIFGEILGDGTVNASDYNAARRFNGSRLPKLPKTGGKLPKAVLVRALARQHGNVKLPHHP